MSTISSGSAIQWLEPATLTEDRAQWFHWSALRSFGLVS